MFLAYCREFELNQTCSLCRRFRNVSLEIYCLDNVGVTLMNGLTKLYKIGAAGVGENEEVS